MSFVKQSTYPPSPLTTRGRPLKISSDPKGERLVYTSGGAVVIRDLRNLSSSIAYTQHIAPVTAARISPSGFYCASADERGTVRVWDIAGSEQILKNELKGAIGGRINDLAWDAESKRIIAVGEGRESFGRAFMMESSSSCGEVIGHSKSVNAVSIRSKRPFRAATSADDGTIVLSTGVPYKFSKVIKSHVANSAVNDVRFSPDGDLLASAGGDGKAFVYDGGEGELKGELTAGAKSAGSLLSLAFAPDSSTLATTAASSIVQLYDPSTLQVTQSFNLSTLSPASSDAIAFQQLGVTYLTPTTLASVSLSGAINLLDTRSPDKISLLYGPLKAITACGVSEDRGKTFWAGGFDGSIRGLKEADGGSWEDVKGTGHKGRVVGLAGTGSSVLSTAWDDCVREIKSGGEGFSPASLPTSSQPTSIASTASGLTVVSAGETVDLILNQKKVASRSFKGEDVLSVATVVAEDGKTMIALGFASKIVRVYSVSSPEAFGNGEPAAVFEDCKGPVHALAFTPKGDFLAAGDSLGKIQVYNVKEKKTAISGRWVSHTSRIVSLRFSASGQHCVSGSIDSNVFIWSVEKPLKYIKIPNAHAGGVAGVEWLDERRIASGGQDGCVRTWEVTFW